MDKELPKVSVLMPVYKGERFIGQAIESALNQTYPNIEVVVVNDGSPDHSGEVIGRYLEDPRVRYIEQANAGVAAARNTALRAAEGKYVAFLDQDDLWLPHKLERQVGYLEAHPEVALVHARQEYIDDGGRAVRDEFINVEPVEGECFRELFTQNRIAVLTVLARRRELERAGYFNPKAARADDYEMWLRISYCRPIGFLDEVVARYRVHGGNESHDAFRMTLADLTVIEAILADLPGVRAFLGEGVVRRRLYELHWQLGSWYMWKQQDFASARYHIREAMRVRPFSIAAWRRWLWCMLSPAQRQRLAWWKTRLTHGQHH